MTSHHVMSINSVLLLFHKAQCDRNNLIVTLSYMMSGTNISACFFCFSHCKWLGYRTSVVKYMLMPIEQPSELYLATDRGDLSKEFTSSTAPSLSLQPLSLVRSSTASFSDIPSLKSNMAMDEPVGT